MSFGPKPKTLLMPGPPLRTTVKLLREPLAVASTTVVSGTIASYTPPPSLFVASVPLRNDGHAPRRSTDAVATGAQTNAFTCGSIEATGSLWGVAGPGGAGARR